MIVAGIDFSMTCPSICIYDTKKELKFENCKFFFLTSKAKLVGSFSNMHGFSMSEYDTQEERFDIITGWAISVLKTALVKRACLEGYSYGSKSSSMTSIAENTGLLKHKMWKQGIEFITPAPTSVKKLFTGKGNANKELMYNIGLQNDPTIPKVDTLYGWNIDSNPMSDIVDSYAMVHFLIHEMKQE